MNRKKLRLTILFSAVMLFMLCNSCQRYDDKKDFTVKVLSDKKTVEITGYRHSFRAARIPPRIGGLRVTIIGKEAFKGKHLAGVTIPKSVTTIEEGAFSGYNLSISSRNKLGSVIIPHSVTYIGKKAFSSSGLTSVTLSKNITAIGEGVFMSNELTSVIIPGKVTRIGHEAFSWNELTSVTIPDSVTHIGRDAFRGNKLTRVAIPDSVIEIREGAFANNKLTEIKIPDNFRSINDEVFADNELTSITIPDGIVSIGDSAFRTNKLTELTIPKKVASIDRDAFIDNKDLIRITIGENVTLGYKAFDGFDSFYKDAVRQKGGTYIFGNYHWWPEDKTIPVYIFESNSADEFSDISFFADMPDLEEVSLSDNKLLTDITSLSGLKYLKKLSIDGCPNIESLKPLSSLTNLETLILEHNNIDLRHIGQLHSLKILFISTFANAKIMNINALRNLVNLERLEINNSGDSDISWMSGLRNLTDLEWRGFTIKDVSPLAALPNLVDVNLRGSRIKDVSPLLRSNSIKRIRVYDEDVEAGISDDLRSRFGQKGIYLDTFRDSR